MNESELLRRIDRYLERAAEQAERIEEEVRLSRELHADNRRYTRELTRRHERVFQGVVRELADLSDQTRANTQAALKVLDRPGPA